MVAIDAKRNYLEDPTKIIFEGKDGRKFWFEVFVYGGKQGTGLDAIKWAKEATDLGAGEVLLTSIDRDGTRDGYDIVLTREVVRAVSVPVIASGGCGRPEDMYEIFAESNVDAALAASIFHYEGRSVNIVKEILRDRGIPVRL